MVQLESDKQVVLFAFLSLLIHLNFLRVCENAGSYVSSMDDSPDGRQTLMTKLESFQLETHFTI